MGRMVRRHLRHHDVGEPGLGGGRLLRNGQLRKAIGSFFTSNPEAVAATQQGKLAIDTHTSRRDRELAARREADARNQLRLLRNEDSEMGQTDFYSYRYFASEGFLPGYNFPRLPLSAFIPGRAGSRDQEYLNRPRFLAISEFGPKSLVYHEGQQIGRAHV